MTWDTACTGDFDLVLLRSGDGDLLSCDSLLDVDEAISATDHILGLPGDAFRCFSFESVVDVFGTCWALVGKTEVDTVVGTSL